MFVTSSDDDRDRDDREAQASLVSVWPSGFDQAGRSVYGVTVSNASSTVFGAVEVELTQGCSRRSTALQFLPPGSWFWSPGHPHYKFPRPFTSTFAPVPVASTDRFSASMQFTDAKGRTWHREGVALGEVAHRAPDGPPSV